MHDSLNHYSYGAISGWLMGGVCGISLENGTLRIAPKPDRSLGFARAEWKSPSGDIRSEWSFEEDRLVFHITVPMPAFIQLPGGLSHEVQEGEYTYEIPV